MAARYPDAPEGLDPVEREIHLMCDQIVQRVNERRFALIAAAREKRQDMRERETRRLQSEQQLLATKAEVERLLKENFLRETQERILAEVEQKLLEVRTPLPQTRLVFRSGAHGHLQQLIAGLGELLEEEVPVVPRYADMRAVVAVGKQGRAPGELFYPNDTAIERNSNQIYVTEGGIFDPFARISVFSEGGEYLSSFTHQEMEGPSGIAIHGDNVYVSDTAAHAVFQFKLGNIIQPVARIGTEGSGIGQFYSPHSLSVSYNGDVYVADCNNHRIEILSSSLQHRRTLTQQPINRPRDVKLTADTVYVLCLEYPSVRVFSHAGEMLRSVVTQEISAYSFYRFCLDKSENIIISDSFADNIEVFSKEGTHIHTLGGQAGEIISPTGLAITNQLSLVVVSYNNPNYGLQIYSCL